MPNNTFIKRSHMDVDVKDLFQWHEKNGALERLSPPWDPIQVIEKDAGIDVGAKVVLKMHAGLVPYTWIAEHIEYKKDSLFRDRQIKGPFRNWTHTHRFIPDGAGGCHLEDRIDFELLGHPFTKAIVPVIQKKLEAIFNYRHTTTAYDVVAHALRKKEKSLNFLVSGSSGLIGSALIPFLTTGGHRVTRLVRRKPLSEKGEIYWSPTEDELDPAGMEGMDVVVHLAGENIGEGRWTRNKKRKILESRIKSTALIADTIAGLDTPPKVLVVASAIGYYGNRGKELMTEYSRSGSDFISRVCCRWEQAACSAALKGVRVVFLRIGIVLSPLGGTLKKVLLPFQMGLGGKFGSGGQYMSWIGIDDVIGAIYHSVYCDRLEGPVNVVAPNPVTNAEFTAVLGKILGRPAVFSIPESMIKIVFGKMGDEIILSSTKVLPAKLLETGYKFRYPDIEGVLRHLLGKQNRL